MPSPFERAFARQAPALRDGFGTPNSAYTGPDGVTRVTLTVRVQRNEAREVQRDVKADGVLQTATVIVVASDFPGVPVKGGRFTVPGQVGAEIWTVEVTPTTENGEFACACSRASTERLIPRRAKE